MNDKKLKQKRKRKQKKYETTTYSIEITDSDVSYSFRLTGKMKDMSWPFWEYMSFDLKGKFLEPKELIGKEVEAIIMGDRRYVHVLQHPMEPTQEPKAIGRLTVRGIQSEFIGSIPYDSLQMLCILQTLEKIKVLEITGEPLYRGSADIQSIRFEKEYKPEEIY